MEAGLRSVSLDWPSSVGADGYVIAWRPAASTDWQFVLQPGEDSSAVVATEAADYHETLALPAEATGAIDVTVGACLADDGIRCSDLTATVAIPVRLEAAPVVASERSAGLLTAYWLAPSAEGAEISLRPDASDADLTDCLAAAVTNPTATSAAIVAAPDACGGPIRDERYEVVVRTVQQRDPLVLGAPGRERSLPRQCRDTPELYCASYPHAFLRTETPDAVAAGIPGEPVVLNGVNIKNGPRPSATGWAAQTNYLGTQIDAVGNGPSQWNVLRLNLDWPTFQYRDETGAIVLDDAAFTELDAVIDRARANGMVVVLNPVHLRIPDQQFCDLPRFSDAAQSIPGFVWALAGKAPGSTPCKDANANSNERLAALQAGEGPLVDYLRAVLARYSGTSERARSVVAIDLVNEIKANSIVGSAAAGNDAILAFYGRLVDDVRTAGPTKILAAQPGHGDSSLARNEAALSAFAAHDPNLQISAHDYFAGAKAGMTITVQPTYGYGRSASGYNQDTIEFGHSTTLATTYTHADAGIQHRIYAEEYVSWASAARLPVFVGEYGAKTPCDGNAIANATRYTRETRDLFDTLRYEPGSQRSVGVSRMWWSAYDTSMRLLGDRAPSDCSPGIRVPYSYAYDT